MELRLVNPRGFCAGVARAIDLVDDLLEASQGPVYVRHEIVHNRTVVDGLRHRGAVFVEEVKEIPPGAIAVISAHGAPPRAAMEAKARGLQLFDATCPLVTKVQLEVMRLARKGSGAIVIGHRSHPEVVGVIGHYLGLGGPGIVVVENAVEARRVAPPHPTRLGFVTQTTLAVSDTERIAAVLRERFPEIEGPHGNDICYATQNRQNEARKLSETCDVVLVVGAPHSSNSVRLVEVAGQRARAYLVETAACLDPAWFAGCARVGLTASASAPESVVQSVVRRLRELDPDLVVAESGEPETIEFRPPQGSRALSASLRAGAKQQPLRKEGEAMNAQHSAEPVGLEDVVRSVRELARNARKLVEEAGGVGEREVAMVLTAAEDARDKFVSAEGLHEAREQKLFKALRSDAHRAVDLGVDAAAVAYVTATRLFEGFLDKTRREVAA